MALTRPRAYEVEHLEIRVGQVEHRTKGASYAQFICPLIADLSVSCDGGQFRENRVVEPHHDPRPTVGQFDHQRLRLVSTLHIGRGEPFERRLARDHLVASIREIEKAAPVGRDDLNGGGRMSPMPYVGYSCRRCSSE